MSEKQNVSAEEINNFKSFMDEYSKEIGAASGLVGELLSDKFIKKLLQTAKQAGIDKLCSCIRTKNAHTKNMLDFQQTIIDTRSDQKYLFCLKNRKLA